MASVTDFLNANSHESQYAHCQIWDGDVDRHGNPIFDMGGTKMQVRALVFASENGPQPSRAKYTAVCENSKCVKIDHIEIELPEKKIATFDEKKVADVKDLFFDKGLRQDVVAAHLGMSQPNVSKIVNYIRKQAKPEVADEG